MKIFTDENDTPLQQKIIEQVKRRLPFLTSGNVYTVAAILGEEFWEDEDENMHKAFGLCFSYMVANQRLPFIQVGWNSVRHNEYHYQPGE